MTNAGEGYTNYMAEVPEYGEVWFNEEALVNLFGLQDLVRRYRVTFDSDRENAFTVHMPHGQVKFKANQEGLYVYKPSRKYRESINNQTRPLIW